MSLDDLSLLRALAARPFISVALANKPKLAALVQEGYVVCSPHGRRLAGDRTGMHCPGRKAWSPPRSPLIGIGVAPFATLPPLVRTPSGP